MKKLLKVVGGFLLVVVVLALGAYAWASSVATRKYEKHWDVHEAAFPIPWPLSDAELVELRRDRVSAGAPAADPLGGVDLEAVALERARKRGQHLVESRAGCSGCHGADFGGSVIIDVPVVGHWVAPNLTAGQGSITASYTPRDWDRAVRHGVRHDGRSSSMPSTEFTNLSDRELSDIVAYIQSRPPVDRDLGPVRLGPVFTFLLATDPAALSAFSIDHQKPHVAEPPLEEPTAVLGEHISQVCRGCHGATLSGGKMAGDPNMPLVANLTPHETGLKSWEESDFIHAMRVGKRPDGSPISESMPWRNYGRMSDLELRALWAYLKSVPAVPKGNH